MTSAAIPAVIPGGPAPRWAVPAVAVGGVVGAVARHALDIAWPAAADAFPWATFVTNVAGCALLGGLMVLVVELGAGHPLLRPFLGVGVLGGFTTFSTYAVQSAGLLEQGRILLALAYLGGTALTALLGVVAGMALVRSLAARTGRLNPSGTA